jgi:hypothetical protein
MEGIQTMKSIFHLVSVCAIAVLLLSSAAFAEILDDYYSDGDSSGNAGSYPGYDRSSVAANSDSSHTSSWAWAGGTDAYYTTVGGTFRWRADLYVWAGAYVTMADGSPEAYASAAAYADLPYNIPSYSVSASAYDDTGVGEADYDSSPPVEEEDYFYAYTGIDCSHEVYCSAHASAYGLNEAVAWAVATADADMW